MLLYPTSTQIILNYPHKKPDERILLKPTLTLLGNGFRNGEYTLRYGIEAARKKLTEGTSSVKVRYGFLMVDIELAKACPGAEGVSWELSAPAVATERGHAPLAWSRFHGKVKYRSGVWHTTTIEMYPITWGAPGKVTIPVADDGTFSALVPARVYAIVNVNGAGYLFDSLERWAWDYNLTKGREDTFTIGRMELYNIHAFEVRGGPRTVFVAFRPSALSRVLSFDADGDHIIAGTEDAALREAMKHSPTAIGPELKPEGVRVWLDGKSCPIVQFNQIPEFGGNGSWQVQYLLQILPEERVMKLVWHEIRLEVESREAYRGERIIDFGEGSVGFRF